MKALKKLIEKHLTPNVLGVLAAVFAVFIGFGAYQYSLLQDRELVLRGQIVELVLQAGSQCAGGIEAFAVFA